jgi:hypothetical protein
VAGRTQGRPAVQANPGLGDAIPLGLGICWVRRTQGRPAVQANPGLGGAIPLGLGILLGGDPG